MRHVVRPADREIEVLKCNSVVFNPRANVHERNSESATHRNPPEENDEAKTSAVTSERAEEDDRHYRRLPALPRVPGNIKKRKYSLK